MSWSNSKTSTLKPFLKKHPTIVFDQDDTMATRVAEQRDPMTQAVISQNLRCGTIPSNEWIRAIEKRYSLKGIEDDCFRDGHLKASATIQVARVRVGVRSKIHRLIVLKTGQQYQPRGKVLRSARRLSERVFPAWFRELPLRLPTKDFQGASSRIRSASYKSIVGLRRQHAAHRQGNDSAARWMIPPYSKYASSLSVYLDMTQFLNIAKEYPSAWANRFLQVYNQNVLFGLSRTRRLQEEALWKIPLLEIAILCPCR
jgi:hypothetical protein